MKPSQRQTWILDQLRGGRWLAVDVVNEDACEAYREMLGEPGHRGEVTRVQFGRDLATLARAGHLERRRVGLAAFGGSAQGYPSWVWSYSFFQKTA